MDARTTGAHHKRELLDVEVFTVNVACRTDPRRSLADKRSHLSCGTHLVIVRASDLVLNTSPMLPRATNVPEVSMSFTQYIVATRECSEDRDP
jgi:hypothetical protein